MHARARRLAMEADPYGDDPAHLASSYAPCGACGGASPAEGRACDACGGMGHVRTDLGRESLDDDAIACVGEFLLARGFVERHGLWAFLRVHGRPHPAFLEAMDEYDAAYALAEHEARVAEAREVRRRRDARGKGVR